MPSELRSGTFTLTTAGVAYQPLAAAPAAQTCVIQAAPGNTSAISVGSADSQDIVLAAGAIYIVALDDPSKIWAKGGTNGDDVNWNVLN